MKASIPIVIAAVVLVIACLALGSPAADRERDDVIARLEQRIDALEQRVEMLEKRLQSVPVARRSAPIRPARPSVRPSHPRGWRRREFNGVPYYVIPLELAPKR
jgi:hypothetical protein